MISARLLIIATSWRNLIAITGLVTLLHLVGCASQPPTPEEVEITPAAGESRPATHTVVRGDSLRGIAVRYGLDYRELANWNGIVPPYRIAMGKELRLYPPGVEPGSRVVARVPRANSDNGAVAAKTPPGEMNMDGSVHWAWPTHGNVVQTFQAGDRTRSGIRIAGTPGQSITAAEAGKVVYSGSGLPGYGQLIILKHAKNYLSAYGFNRKLLVHDGEVVNRGDPIAEMGVGNDGQPLLHFEIRQGDKVLDPLRFLPRL